MVIANIPNSRIITAEILNQTCLQHFKKLGKYCSAWSRVKHFKYEAGA